MRELDMNKKRVNIVIGIAIVCFSCMIMGLISGVFGGSTRDGAVYPPVELKALPLKIIKYVMYGGIPCSAIALLIDEEKKWVKKRGHQNLICASNIINLRYLYLYSYR